MIDPVPSNHAGRPHFSLADWGSNAPFVVGATSPSGRAARRVLGLIHGLASTEYGRAHGVHHLSDVSRRKDFVRALPVVKYDELKPWIERAMAGRECPLARGNQVVCPSSGTTTDQFKWLPVTRDALQRGHYRGGKDLLAQYCAQVPEAQLYQGKHLILGGSSALVHDGHHAVKGDLSAIIVNHLRLGARPVEPQTYPSR